MEWERVSNDEIDRAVDRFAGLSSAALARLCGLIGEVDRRQSWMTDGARSLTDWVAARLRVRHQYASQLVGVARRLEDLPVLTERFASGVLSLDQVDAISKMATLETESGLIEEALGLTNSALDLKARRSGSVSEDDAQTVHERRRLWRQWNLDESELRFGGRLPAVAGRVFDQAIDTQTDVYPPDPETGMFAPAEVRAADALVDLTAGERVDIQLTVFSDSAHAELDNTTRLSETVFEQVSCDTTLRHITTTADKPVGVGRKTRRIPDWLHDLVVYRDGGQCQFPGCRNRRYQQIHHIQHWADGGPTNLDNLILLCDAHHRFIHKHHWHITQNENRWQFRRPDWTIHPPPRTQLDPRLSNLVRMP